MNFPGADQEQCSDTKREIAATKHSYTDDVVLWGGQMRDHCNAKSRINRARFAMPVFLVLSGCATANLDHAGTLTSYAGLKRSDGMLTHSEVRLTAAPLLAAKSVSLVPTVFGPRGNEFDTDQRKLVANAIDRSLCHGLASRFRVVGSGEPADLILHTAVTHAESTNAAAAGVSKAVGIVPGILVPGVPIPVPRLPIGMGALTVEAEATDRNGSQAAAMVWGRGADSITSKARVSSDGDAYDLASSFGEDFSTLLVTAADPMKAHPSMPSAHDLLTKMNIGSGDPDCDRFGPNPGVAGLLAGGIGLPPTLADKGNAAEQAQ